MGSSSELQGLHRRESLVAVVCALCVVAVGLTVLAGWHLGSSSLVRLYPRFAAMPYNTALVLTLLGLALLVLARSRSRSLRLLALPFVAVPVIYSVSSMLQNWLDIQLGIDEVLFAYPSGGRYPGRMSMVTASCVLVLAASLAWFCLAVPGSRAGTGIALASCGVIALSAAVIVTALLAIGVPRTLFFAMAPPTGVGLCALGLGVLALTAQTAPAGALPDRLPAFVLVSLGAVGLVVWQALDAARHESLDRATATAALMIEQQLEHGLEQRLTAFARTARRWQLQGRPAVMPEAGPGREPIDIAVGCLTIEWFAPDGARAWIVASPGTEKLTATPVLVERRRELMAAVEQQAAPRVAAGPLADGASGLVMCCHAAPSGPAYLIITWQAADLLASIVHERIAPGYALALRDGEGDVYRRPGAGAAGTTCQRSRAIELLDSPFRLDVWPTAELIAQQQSRLPEIVLAAGLVLTLLLAGLVRFAQVARHRAAELASAIAALSQEVAERRRAEEARRHAEEESNRLQDQLMHARKMEAVGQLAGGIAHDFNNLLTVVLGHCELLQARLHGDAASTSLGEIEHAARRAAERTSQLLAFGRKLLLSCSLIDLNPLIREAQARFSKEFGDGVKVLTLLRPGLGLVYIDPDQIGQVLHHLARNAAEAMPAGGELTLATTRVELDLAYARQHAEVRPGPYIMVAVQDTGCGMDQPTLEHLFEPFFTTKDKGGGTGLGLASVYGIVKQSGGHIEVESQPARGSVFRLYFPCAEASAEAAPAPVGEVVAGGTETILLVEDDLQVCEVVRQLLLEGGHSVLSASDAEEALSICAQHDGDIALLLTGVVRGEMNGPTLADWAGALRPGLKVLFMSGYADSAPLDDGAYPVFMIPKPPTFAGLINKVRQVLDSESARQPT